MSAAKVKASFMQKMSRVDSDAVRATNGAEYRTSQAASFVSRDEIRNLKSLVRASNYLVARDSEASGVEDEQEAAGLKDMNQVYYYVCTLVLFGV